MSVQEVRILLSLALFTDVIPELLPVYSVNALMLNSRFGYGIFTEDVTDYVGIMSSTWGHCLELEFVYIAGSVTCYKMFSDLCNIFPPKMVT